MAASTDESPNDSWRPIAVRVFAGLVLLLFARSFVRDAVTMPAKATVRSEGDAGSAASNHDTRSNSGKNGKWIHYTRRDQMHGTITENEVLLSDNEIDSGFPYGKSKGMLVLRITHGGDADPISSITPTVFLHVKGQFVCDIGGAKNIDLKLDHKPIRHFTCRYPEDGSRDSVFIEDSTLLGFQLEKASALTIEAVFYQNGRKQLNVSVR